MAPPALSAAMKGMRFTNLQAFPSRCASRCARWSRDENRISITERATGYSCDPTLSTLQIEATRAEAP